MKMSTLALTIFFMLVGNIAAADGLFNRQYKAAMEGNTRLTPAYHVCLTHRALRTLQETRVNCSVADTPAHIGGWESAWQIHEETWLVDEDIVVNSDCSQKVTKTTQTLLSAPQYWPEDDIWNPTSYANSGLTEFNCGDLDYDPLVNRTAEFIYRIIVSYQIQ